MMSLMKLRFGRRPQESAGLTWRNHGVGKTTKRDLTLEAHHERAG